MAEAEAAALAEPASSDETSGLPPAKDIAVRRLQRFVRQRTLRAKWLELVYDLVDWHRLYRQLQENKEKRAKAASLLQRRTRNSPHTNIAMRVASKASAPVVFAASKVMNAYARGWVWRSRLKRLKREHVERLNEASQMAVAQSEAVSASDADAQLVPGLHWRWSPGTSLSLIHISEPTRPY